MFGWYRFFFLSIRRTPRSTSSDTLLPYPPLVRFFVMLRAGVSANLMSLGGLDFGLIVDGPVIIVENALRRLAGQQHHEGRLLSVKERLATVAAAAREMI